MKIVNILGGLGNQMFEYAMYLALKDAHPQEDIKVCTRSFGGYGLHNGLEIQRIFGVELPEASLLELTKVAYPFFNYKAWQVMRHFLPVRKSMTRGGFDIPFDFSQVTREDSCYYEGYWQNEGNFKHIRNKILEAYSFHEFSDERTLDSFRKELSVHGLVSESDVNELKEEILHTLSESSFSVITTVNADEILKSAHNVADLTRLTKEDTMHEILVTSVAMHIAMQNGQIEAESEMATPEAIAVGVAAGYEEMKVISQLEKGEIDDEGAWESIKLISAVVGVTLFMIAATAVVALTASATFIGFLEMFGSSMVVAIMGGIVAMSVGYLIVLPIINNIEWFIEKGGELLDKVVDNLRMRVIPTIKKRIEVFTEKVSNLIHSGVVWVKSLFSRRRQGQR